MAGAPRLGGYQALPGGQLWVFLLTDSKKLGIGLWESVSETAASMHPCTHPSLGPTPSSPTTASLRALASAVPLGIPFHKDH